MNDETNENVNEELDGSVSDEDISDVESSDVEKDKDVESSKAESSKSEDDNETPAEPEVPEKYDYKLSDGMQVDEALAEKMEPVFKDLKLSNEQANKLAEVYAETIKQQEAKAEETYKGTIKQWEDQVKNDPDMGGNNFDKTRSKAASGLERFGTPELSDFLDEYGIGSHPEIVRLFAKFGEMSEDDNVAGGQPASRPKTRAEILYG